MVSHFYKQPRLILLFAACVAIIAAAFFVHWKTQAYIEFKVYSTSTDPAQLFFDTGNGFNQDESSMLTVQPLSEGWRILKFSVPAAKIQAFRFDPFSHAGRMIIDSIQIVKQGEVRKLLTGIRLLPTNQISEISYSNAGAMISTVEGAHDPFMVVLPQTPLDLGPGFTEVYLPAFLLLVLSFSGMCLLMRVAQILHGLGMACNPYRAVVGRLNNFAEYVVNLAECAGRFFNGIAARLSRSKACNILVDNDNRQLMILSLSLLMTIAGARLLVLKIYGTDLPWFDSWGAEGSQLYKRFLKGTLPPGFFFESHNEHRILFSRLLALAIFLLNGLWDNLLQTVINALIYSMTGVGLFWLIGRSLSGIYRAIWCLAVAVTFSLPYDWENALWGFQSCFYIMAMLSILVLFVASMTGTVTMKSLVGLSILQVAALFTMGSGVMASVAALGMYLVIIARNGHDKDERRLTWIKVAIAIAVIVTGFMLLVHVPVHDNYKAPTVVAFLNMFSKCASWPYTHSNIWWVVNWFPWATVTVLYLLRKTEDKIWVRFAIALGIWVVLQEAATAYSRNPLALISKYSDPMALGLPANVLAMIVVHASLRGPWKRGLVLFALLWVITNSYHLMQMTSDNIEGNLPGRKHSYDIQILKTRLFLRTGNIEMLAIENKYDIPDRSPEGYAVILNDPIIRSILPRSVNDLAFATGRPHAYLSKASDLLLNASKPLLFCGTFLLSTMSVLMLAKKHRERKR